MPISITANRPATTVCVAQKSQSGAALVISLILVTVMAIVAVESISSTRVELQIVNNTQRKVQTYEVAESVIGAIWQPTLIRSILVGSTAISEDDPEAVVVPQTIVSIDMFDTELNGNNLDFDGEVRMRFCGESPVPGSSLDANLAVNPVTTTMFEVTSQVLLKGSGAESVHVRRGALTAVSTKRSGTCGTR